MSNVNPHLDDDALSAAIDGEASLEESAHAASCDECRHRMGRLRAAATAAAAIPLPEPDERDAAVRAAVAAATLPTGVAPTALDARRRRATRRRPAMVAAGALAAALLAVVGVATLVDGGEGDGFDAASSDVAAGTAVDAGFLGTFDDDRDLALRLGARLGDDESRAELYSADGAADDVAGSGSAGAEAPTDAQATADSFTAAEEVAPPAGSIPRLADEAVDECARAMAEEFPEAGERVLVARIVWREEPAAVFVHRQEDDGPRRAWVYAGEPCRLRSFLSF